MQVFSLNIPKAAPWRGLTGPTRRSSTQVVDLADSLQELREMLRAWEAAYNGYRPHQALGYPTPKAFYQKWGA